ncbi:MmyB family transcriptional regulator [Flindersiella endophytica]
MPLADALLLSEPERQHLHLVARCESPAPRHRPVPARASLRVMLAGLSQLPAYVVGFRLDVLAHNQAAAALFGTGFGTGWRPISHGWRPGNPPHAAGLASGEAGRVPARARGRCRRRRD